MIYRTPLDSVGLRPRAPTSLIATPPDLWPGDAAHGRAFLARDVGFGDPAQAEGPDDLSARDEGATTLQSFEWLRDIRSVGGDAARRRARQLIGDWIDIYAEWHPLAWRADVLGRRVFAWLGQHDFCCASADDAFRSRYFASLARQAKHLTRAARAEIDCEGRVAALKGLAVAGVCLPGRASWTDLALKQLERELSRQVLADGGHATRSPVVHLTVLRHLIDLRASLLAAGRDVPQPLQAFIGAMATILRMLRHGDGCLALFNGGNEASRLHIDLAFTHIRARPRAPVQAPDVGYHRLLASRTLVIADSGAAPAAEFAGAAHAGPLSFEMSVGRERLIVNTGARSGTRAAWASAQRATAAHSTLVIDDTNAAEVLPDGGFGRAPRILTCEHNSADDSHWLDASHDGYCGKFGLIHRRRLYLAAAGDDLRGEDCLVRAGGPAGAGAPFTIHFHLHPDVQASLVHSGRIVLLRLPRGGGWQLTAHGGVLDLAAGIYLGGPGELRRTEQVIISGVAGEAAVGDAAATVKWGLRRLAGRR